jgi:predicted nucleic acid-binding protein
VHLNSILLAISLIAMKQMNDNVFLDTNILVYSYSDTEIDKQIKARQIVSENTSFISTQVLQELSNVFNRKFNRNWIEIEEAINEVLQNNVVHTNSYLTIQQAIRIARQYKFSFYDSLIISAALESKCTALYSEDLNSGQLIDSKLAIVNPFI